MIKHFITVGDRRTPLGVTLYQSGGAVDLIGATVEVAIHDNAGNEIKAYSSTGVTVVDAANGQVSYEFQADEVDEAGTYWVYFRVTSSGKRDTWPVKPDRSGRARGIQLVISTAG